MSKNLTRVLMVSEPGAYGVFLNVRLFIRFLHQAHPEITVDLAWSSRRSWPETAALGEEIRAHGGEAIDLGVGNSPELRDLAAMIQLLRLVWRRSPQLVHAHSSKAGGLCRLLSMVPGFPPVLYTPHAYYGMARDGGRRERFFNFLELVLGRLALSQVVSADERRFALETLNVSPRSLVLINNGILTDRFIPADAATKSAARDKLGIPREGKLLITIGRDSSQKNFAPLYAALNPFFATDSAVQFAHAGGGSVMLREGIDPAFRNRCHCFEYMAEVRNLLWAADGFILTSLYEGLSVSMLEAMSCGLPLQLTDAPGLGGMRAFGLDIDWLPDPRECGNFVDEVLKSLLIWNRRPAGVLWDQHVFARQTFNAPIQYGKIVRLYGWLATKG